MSEFRRRLMGGLGVLPTTTQTDIFTNTSETEIAVPSNAVAMDIFLCGGGGGGGAWNTWGWTNGGAGLGGECFCKRNISLTGVSTIKYQCGQGGACATSTSSSLMKYSSDGGSTTLTVGDTTYTAKGGVGGLNALNQSIYSAVTLPTGTSTHWPTFVQNSTNQIGYDERVLTKYGLEGAYMRGLTVMQESCWFTYDNIWQDEASIEYQSQYDSATYPTSVDIYDFGVPLFFEDGNPTCGAQGNYEWKIRRAVTYGSLGSAVYNSSEGIARYNASGYGGGGFGGSFRTSAIKYGGNGTSGLVAIRWYLK